MNSSPSTGLDAERPVIGSAPAVPSRPLDDIDVLLLQRTQAYLEARRDGGEQSRVLAEAWGEFYRQLDPLVRALVRSHNRSEFDQTDAVQEVWSVLFVRLPAYRHDAARGRFFAWLTVVARRTLANLKRRAPPRSRMTSHALDPTATECRLEGPATFCERREEIDLVARTLAAFRERSDPATFAVVERHWLDDRTAAEIADELGLSYGQVWGRLHRMKVRLRECFERELSRGRSGAGIR